MDQPWYILMLACFGGVLAGIINTLAGSGSLVTLPILVALGLPAHIANATNRVGIVIQSVVGVGTMQRTGQLALKGSSWFIGAAVLGSIVGARVAAGLSEQVMNIVIAILMGAMLIMILVKPNQWLREQSERDDVRPSWWLLLIFLGIGFYGGFIQAGVGVMLLTGLVLGAKYSLKHANGIKLVIAMCFTLAALGVFIVEGLVNWQLGLLMGLGQATGAWIAARFLMQREGAAIWIRRLLIVIVILGIARMLAPLLTGSG